MKKLCLSLFYFGFLMLVPMFLFPQIVRDKINRSSTQTIKQSFNICDSLFNVDYKVLISGDTVKLIGSGSAIKHVYGSNFTQLMTYNLSISFTFIAHDPVPQGTSLKYSLQIVSGTIHHWGVATDYFYGSTTTLNFDYTHNYGYLSTQGSVSLSYPQNTINSLSFPLPYSPYANHFDPYYLQFGSPNSISVYLANFDIWEFDKSYPINGSVSGLVKSNNIYVYNHYDNKIKLIAKTAPTSDPIVPIKICADASENVTKIVYARIPQGVSATSIIFRIEEDPSGLNAKEFGSFANKSAITSDSIIIDYHHPRVVNTNTLYKTINLQVFINTGNGLVLKSNPIHLYRAPITFVHGLWGNPNDFKDMSNYFTNTLKYLPKVLTNPTDYQKTSSFHFSNNAGIVATSIDATIKNAIAYGYSSGKTDVVCHSMGGILTRYWIQNPQFTNNINRFITLNTPHSGTQAANLLREYYWDIGVVFDILQKNTRNGAVDDLSVNSQSIINLNKLGNTQSVQSHVIESHQDENGLSVLLDYRALFITGLIKDAFPEHINVFEDIFNEQNHDLIVPALSQSGGFSGSIYDTPFENIWHSASPDNLQVKNGVHFILCQDPEDISFFTKSSFSPPELLYTFQGFPQGKRISKVNKTTNADSIIILSPMTGSTVNPGSTINIHVAGTLGIKSILLGAGGTDMDFFSQKRDSSSANFSYTIPLNAAYNTPITAIGFDQYGTVNMDSIKLYVNIPYSPDSIIIASDHLYVGKGETVSLGVTGCYPDSITRDLSSNPGISYQVTNPTIATFTNPGILKGLINDTTSVLISFKGKTKRVPVTVIEPVSCIYSVPAIRNLQNITITAEQNVRYDATRIINIAGSNTIFYIQNGGEVTISAGNKISLLPGFKVNPGGSCLVMIPTDGGYCRSQNIIGNTIVDDGQSQCYEALDTLTVAGNGATFTIKDGASCTLVAGQKIVLLPGTKVNSGGNLYAIISTNGQYCNFSLNTEDSIILSDNKFVPDQIIKTYFKIYPNPTFGSITIEFMDEQPDEKLTVEIYNMHGERFLSSVIKGERKHSFSLEGFPTGVYITRVICGRKVETAKLIKL